jgi:site-specific recombinase XerC
VKRFHDLRHFFASMLIENGESAKYIQDQVGHASITTTFDTYGHLMPQAKRTATKNSSVQCSEKQMLERSDARTPINQIMSKVFRKISQLA